MRRLGGVAAVLGGLAWAVKAGSVLAGGAQPRYLAEFAPAAHGLALVAMAWALRCGPVARAVALAAFGTGAMAAWTYAATPEHWLYNLAMFAATVLVVVALVLVGRTVGRRAALGRWSRLPGRIGLSTLPLILAGGLLSSVDERLLELPVLLLGLAWLWLGIVLLLGEVRQGKGQEGDAPDRPKRPVRRARQPAGATRRP